MFVFMHRLRPNTHQVRAMCGQLAGVLPDASPGSTDLAALLALGLGALGRAKGAMALQVRGRGGGCCDGAGSRRTQLHLSTSCNPYHSQYLSYPADLAMARLSYGHSRNGSNPHSLGYSWVCVLSLFSVLTPCLCAAGCAACCC
jgi:hypothetical protein